MKFAIYIFMKLTKSNLERGALNLECEGSRANHRSPGLVKVVRMTGTESFPRSVGQSNDYIPLRNEIYGFAKKNSHSPANILGERAWPRIPFALVLISSRKDDVVSSSSALETPWIFSRPITQPRIRRIRGAIILYSPGVPGARGDPRDR